MMFKILQKSFEISSNQKTLANQAVDQLLARTDLGFFKLPERENLWQDVTIHAEQLRNAFDDLVVVGIGGSSLGPKALYEIFLDPKNKKRLHFCDNVDAFEYQRLFQQIPSLEKTAFLFISKSGGTIETLVSRDYILAELESRSLDLKKHIRVISEKRSNSLTDWAQKAGIAILEIPMDVGGRFSVLTAVGMLPMAFLGVPIAELRQGAAHALKDKKNISEVVAQTMLSYERDEWISFFWFYCSSLKGFGLWLEQLWAESLAKKLDRQERPAPRASTPVTAVGACDQHSLLQQVIHGAKDKFVLFVRVAQAEKGPEPLAKSHFSNQAFFVGHTMGELLAAEAAATQQALSQEGVSTMTLQIEDLSPESIGYQLMFWELVVGALGEAMDINAFDQPGVELGKRLAKEILKR